MAGGGVRRAPSTLPPARRALLSGKAVLFNLFERTAPTRHGWERLGRAQWRIVLGAVRERVLGSLSIDSEPLNDVVASGESITKPIRHNRLSAE